jgi:hypothetical protein
MAQALTTAQWNQLPPQLAIAPLCGLNPANFVPPSLYDQCLTVAKRNIPKGAPSDWVSVCQGSLIVRGIIYYKKVPGDCGTPTSLDLENVSAAGQAGQIATGIASMAGAQLPGIGVAVQAIQAIFAHHAEAVANEQATICQVAKVFNQVIGFYDAKVRSGAISPSAAWNGMQNFLAQVTEQLASIFQQCNASCVYTAIINAHSDFVQSYYPAIAPVSVFSHAPGAAPASLGTTPGGVIQVGGAIADTVAAPIAASIGVPVATLGLIVGALLLLFVIGWAVTK